MNSRAPILRGPSSPPVALSATGIVERRRTVRGKQKDQFQISKWIRMLGCPTSLGTLHVRFHVMITRIYDPCNLIECPVIPRACSPDRAFGAFILSTSVDVASSHSTVRPSTSS
ncbi:hypothetical protein D5086_010992 [Populus alba]|uniref:Uncharacterized protein n=1 Tax=Populus alba TaxID=43335 RepID=A0ACC4CB56_POPAL